MFSLLRLFLHFSTWGQYNHSIFFPRETLLQVA